MVTKVDFTSLVMCVHTPRALSDLSSFPGSTSFKAMEIQLKWVHLFSFPSNSFTQASGKNLTFLLCLQQQTVLPPLAVSLHLPYG